MGLSGRKKFIEYDNSIFDLKCVLVSWNKQNIGDATGETLCQPFAIGQIRSSIAKMKNRRFC